MTATVETITEQLDMAVSLPAADAPTLATAQTVTLTDTDVATATAAVSVAGLYVQEIRHPSLDRICKMLFRSQTKK